MNAPAWTLEPLGEDAVLLRLGAHIESGLNRQVHALAAHISAARPPWLRDIVPAYAACRRELRHEAHRYLLV